MIQRYWPSILASILVLIGFGIRIYLPDSTGEEGRYASAAWQMYIQHEWLIPRISGAIYLDKPPLFYWLMIIGWHITEGIEWPLLIPVLFAMAMFFLTQRLASVLYPKHPRIAQLAPLILLGMPYAVMHFWLVRLDMQLAFFALLSCYVLCAQQTRWSFWLFTFANTLGVLAKGPVVYLFTIPEIILFAWFHQEQKSFVLRYVGAILLSLVLCLAWLVPLVVALGKQTLHTIFIDQLYNRTTGAQGGSKPAWYYLPIILQMFVPFLLYAGFWRKKSTSKMDYFLLVGIAIPCIVFSLMHSKQERYLLPLMPLVAIYIASRVEGCSIKSHRVIGVLCLLLGIIAMLLLHYATHLPVVYRQYFPYQLLLVWLVGGVFLLVRRKQGWLCLCLVSFLMVTVASFGYVYAIAQVRPTEAIAKRIHDLQEHGVEVVSTTHIVESMPYVGRWRVPVKEYLSGVEEWGHQAAWVLSIQPYVFPVGKNCEVYAYTYLSANAVLCFLR